MQRFIGGIGCFWDETKYEGIPGVISTECGYCGGKSPTASYEQVCGGDTEHVEVVKVEFDPHIISYEEVTKLFFKFHNPTTPNQQGLNKGYQYRSEIFYNTDEEKKIAKKLNPKVKLIDLSADFRLESPKNYKKWYNITHKSKNLIKHSIYSIPELINVKLDKFRIIACPGCYPTSIQIPLVPIIKNKLINTKNIIIDSKSGYSGAGKNLHKKFKFKNIYESISAYDISSHRHLAEIDQQLKKISNNNIKVQFTPHLSPMFRGILSTIYVNLNKNIIKTIKFQFNYKIEYNYRNRGNNNTSCT